MKRVYVASDRVLILCSWMSRQYMHDNANVNCYSYSITTRVNNVILQEARSMIARTQKCHTIFGCSTNDLSLVYIYLLYMLQEQQVSMQHQLSKSCIHLFTVYASWTTGIMPNSKDGKKEHPQINQTDKKSSSSFSLGENTLIPDLLEGDDRN